MNQFFRDKCFYFFMAISMAVAVPVMAGGPDDTDGDVVVNVPAAPKKKAEKPAKDESGAQPTDEGTASNPNKGGNGYVNFGGGASVSDVGKTGMGHASVGYSMPDGGRVDAKVMGESGEYASFKLNLDGLGPRFVCSKAEDKFCFKLGFDLDARYGIGSSSGEIGGAILPTLQLRFKTEDGTEIGLGGGLAAGGIYSARVRDTSGANMGEGGVGPQIELFLNHKWVKGRLGVKNIFGLSPDAPTRNYFDARANVFVPFGTTVPVGWYLDAGVKVLTEDPNKVVVPAPTPKAADVQHVDFTGTTGFQFVF